MGEAGPEGILPLTRRNGRMGVDASGMAAAPVNITMISQPGVEVSHSTERQNGQDHHRFFARQIDKSLATGQNDGAMKSRFGMGTQGVKR
jgi:phage-related minor tail protein